MKDIYTASANRDSVRAITELERERDSEKIGSVQWVIYDAAVKLAKMMAQQWEDA